MEINGTLRNACRIEKGLDPRAPCLSGNVYGDTKGRFYDGERITTSTILDEDGDVFRTRYSAYKVESWAGEEPKKPANDNTADMTFQKRVDQWMVKCFSREIAENIPERNHRFLEEALELVQSTGATAQEAHMLVDYVFSREVGDPAQELGGVMVTLAALSNALGFYMDTAGIVELDRVNRPEVIEKVRAKQLTKPLSSPLPGIAE